MKHYLGVDLGGTKIAAGIVDESHRITARRSVAVPESRSLGAVAERIAETARAVAADAGLTDGDFGYIGVGAPGAVDPTTQRVVFANNLGWRDADLEGELRRHWDLPVKVANDADCAALGECFAGAAKDFSDVLMLTLGTGVGGSFVINKKIYTGGSGYGCEPGHSLLVFGGEPCTCGRRGCIEAYASVTALIRQTVEMMAHCPESLMCRACGFDIRKVDGRTAFDAAKKGDAAAKRVVENYTGYLAAGISSLVTAFRPSAVIIGGGLSNEGEYLLEPVRRIVSDTTYAAGVIAPPAIRKAILGNEAGIIGAALLGV